MTQHTSNTNTPTRKEGTLYAISRGIGWVIIDDNEELPERIEIPDIEALGTGLNKDRVIVAIHPKVPEGPQTGEVLEIISRAKTQFVGTVDKKKNTCFILPDDRRMYVDIFLPPNEGSKVKDKQKVLIEITQWSDPKKNPAGKVLKVIGDAGDHNTEMVAMALEQGFDSDFDEAVLAEAEQIPSDIPEEEIQKRRDMRGIATMTVDPGDAKDFDDALSYQVLPDGNVEIGIHIADVTHYVRPGTLLDKEARERATSVYLVDRTIPMLPEKLSNGICSLRPDEDRLAFSAIFIFSKESLEKGKPYTILDEWYGRTVIRSQKRFVYEEAQDVMDTGNGPFVTELRALNVVAHKLREEKFAKGAISFEKDEIKVILDENNRPIRVDRKVRKDIHKMIEDFMLLANRKVAEFVEKKIKGVTPFVYRVHAAPNEERIEDLAIFLKSIGYDLKVKNGAVSSHDINRLLQDAIGEAEQNIVHTATIRTMAKAVYSMKNIGHFGLAFEHYTHFTSPIRRYPDMLVHRLLNHYLSGEKIPKEEAEKLRALTVYTSEREQEATEAERESIKFKQAEYMQSRIGTNFRGVISGVSRGGIFIEEKETGAEGMIRLRDLSDDYYVLDEKNFRIVGERTKRTFQLGDEIDVKLTGVNIEKKQIDFTLADKT